MTANHNHAVVPTGNVSKPPPYMCKICEEPILWDKEGERWFHADRKQKQS